MTIAIISLLQPWDRHTYRQTRERGNVKSKNVGHYLCHHI